MKLPLMAMLMLSLNAIPQTDSISSAQATDSTVNAASASHHSFYSGLGYGSNMIYLGSTISQNQPYGYAALTYGFRDELFLTASAIHLSERSPFMAFYNFSMNYSHTVNSWFDFSLGIYRYQVAPSLADTLFGNFNYVDAALGFDWKLLYTTISYGGILVRNGGSYLQVKNSRYFETPVFMHKKAYVSFDPYVNLLLGTLITSETTNGTIITVTHPNRPWGSTTTTNTGSTTYTKKFGLMEASFGLPVTFNTDIITVEAETSYILPVYTDPDYTGIKGFVFLLSVYFRIF